MKLLLRCNFLKHVSHQFRPIIIRQDSAFSFREYVSTLSSRRHKLRYPILSSVSCLYSSDEKKQFLTFEKKAHALKDAFEHKKEQLKDTEHRIRQRSEEIVRDIKHQKEVTGQKLRVKKEYIIKDILETKAKVKERIEEVVEKENVLTVPNILCFTRIAMSPYLGYTIFQENYNVALGLLVFAGVTDLLDGYIARNWKGQSTKMGSFLDPMADKVLVGTLFISLTYQNLIPLSLTLLIVSRDVALVVAAFVIRYMSLPPPRTLSRYFDVTHATAQLAPTLISKVNTAVQLLLPHDIRFDKPQVLAKENRFLPRMIREAIEIKKHPNFNREDGWVLPPAWNPIIESLKSKSKPKAARPKDTVGTTLASPVFGFVDHPAIHALFGVTAATTIVSAFSYLVSKDTYKFLKHKS